MTASEAAFTGLIDYAGLYPPASLGMRDAVRNYLSYCEQKHAWMLGRFIVDLARLAELHACAGDAISRLRISVIAPVDADPAMITHVRDAGFRIEAVEIRCDVPLKIARMREHLPPELDCWIEVPMQSRCTAAIDAIAAVGARVKLRMGGIVPEAFPTAAQVAERLVLLADRRVAFKATAGLHHPIRSLRPLTYAPDSPRAVMHGFLNVFTAAAFAWQVMYVIPAQKCESVGNWWEPTTRTCATPVFLPHITGRPIGQSARAQAAVEGLPEAERRSPKAAPDPRPAF